MDNSNFIDPSKALPKKKRRRTSKLDDIYYPVAQLLLESARLKLAGKRPLSLETIADRIGKEHGIAVVKSTLSRYLSKHGALKLL